MAKKIFTWLYYLVDLVLTPEEGDFSAKVTRVRHCCIDCLRTAVQPVDTPLCGQSIHHCAGNRF